MAQLARASALHAEGHRFDSDILHQQEIFYRIFEKKFFQTRMSANWRTSSQLEHLLCHQLIGASANRLIDLAL